MVFHHRQPVKVDKDAIEHEEPAYISDDTPASLYNITILDNNIILDITQPTIKHDYTKAPFVITASTMETVLSSHLMHDAYQVALQALQNLSYLDEHKRYTIGRVDAKMISDLARLSARIWRDNIPGDLMSRIIYSIPGRIHLQMLRLLVEVLVWEGIRP